MACHSLWIQKLALTSLCSEHDRKSRKSLCCARKGAVGLAVFALVGLLSRKKKSPGKKYILFTQINANTGLLSYEIVNCFPQKPTWWLWQHSLHVDRSGGQQEWGDLGHFVTAQGPVLLPSTSSTCIPADVNSVTPSREKQCLAAAAQTTKGFKDGFQELGLHLEHCKQLLRMDPSKKSLFHTVSWSVLELFVFSCLQVCPQLNHKAVV